jgi:hypothetical protein
MRRIVQWVVRWIGRADTIQSVGKWLVAPVVTAVVVGIRKFLEDRPLSEAIVWGLAAFFIVVGIVAVLVRSVSWWLEHRRRALKPQIEFSPVMEFPMLVALGITNKGPTDKFHAQVVGWGEGDRLEPMPPMTLRWLRPRDSRLLKIASGITEYLEIAYSELRVADTFPPSPKGQLAVEVHAEWHRAGALGYYLFSEPPTDFETRTWSLHVIVATLGSEGQQSQGVRLHLFGKTEDAPAGHRVRQGWYFSSPTLGISLFDLTPAPESNA